MDWLPTLFGSIIGSLILSILGNVLTDPVKTRLTKILLTSKIKRQQSLQREFYFIERLYYDRQSLYIETMLMTIRSFVQNFVGIIFFTMAIMTMLLWFHWREMNEPTVALIGLSPSFSFPIHIGLVTGVLIGSGLACIGLGIGDMFSIAKILVKTRSFDEYKEEVKSRVLIP